LPMVLTTLFFSLTGRFAMHRRIARWAFPVWLYVSITGVVVFAFLKVFAY
jgi:putative membrane protein